MNHQDYVNKTVELLRSKGWTTETEVQIPNGKGAVDIVARDRNQRMFLEIKSSPTSIKKKKVQSQLLRYYQAFGEGHYGLVSPSAHGELELQLTSNYRGRVIDFINNFK